MLKSEIFVPLEIEIQLVPGLPTIQFLGLPSPGLKESAMRIRSALRAADFQMPKGRQILVDVRPREEKKHGRGVDLAVAIGYLILTNQVEAKRFQNPCYYGDLSLSGEISAPSDWRRKKKSEFCLCPVFLFCLIERRGLCLFCFMMKHTCTLTHTHTHT
jgi:magnesium chelatase family protein